MDNVPLKIQQFAHTMIYFVLWVIEMALLLRFILKLLGANPANQLVVFAYSAGAVFLGPFANIFGAIMENGIIIEPSILVAMMVYAIIGYLLVALMGMASRRYPTHFS